jgi:hypothetical protein
MWHWSLLSLPYTLATSRRLGLQNSALTPIPTPMKQSQRCKQHWEPENPAPLNSPEWTPSFHIPNGVIRMWASWVDVAVAMAPSETQKVGGTDNPQFLRPGLSSALSSLSYISQETPIQAN